MLIWMAWGIFVIWAARHINHKWMLYRTDNPYAQDPPEFSTFLFVELVLISNGLLHMVLDRKTLYPVQTRGFLGSGYTEAQLFFTAAWCALIVVSVRWYWKFTRGDPDMRWHLGCWLGIIGLITTSIFCCLILDLPISRDTPFL